MTHTVTEKWEIKAKEYAARKVQDALEASKFDGKAPPKLETDPKALSKLVKEYDSIRSVLQPTLVRLLRKRGKFSDKYGSDSKVAENDANGGNQDDPDELESDGPWGSHDSDSIISDIADDESDDEDDSDVDCCTKHLRCCFP
jgi:hypothetical protein